MATQGSAPRWLHTVLFTCFYLSGAAGLTYQVSWMKALGLVFGQTTYAITAVLCAFMAGLALGSWFWGRYVERARDALRLYGWIELGIAATGLASLGGIWLIRWMYPPVHGVLADSPALLLAYRFLASFLVLLVPTTLMGGTYPVVLKFLTERSEQLGGFASRLYWLNTAGAITGACATGFVLLWHLGLLRTVLLAMTLNLIVAALVLVSARRLRASAGEPASEPAPPEVAVLANSPVGAGTVLVVTWISGFTAMVFEIGWTRILAIFLSSTTYAFTLMLATFLLGITLGSYLFERWHRRWKLSHRLLGQFLTLLALSGLLFLAVSAQLAELARFLASASQGSTLALLGSQFLVSFLAMILPTVLFGLTFPLTVVLYCGEDLRRGARAGVLYGVNTLGSILGAFVTGLFLIQWLSTVNSLLLASGVLALVATGLFVSKGLQPSASRAAVGGLVLLLIVGAALTNVFAAPFIHGRSIVGNITRSDFQSPLTMAELLDMEKRVYAREGVNATVVVARLQGYVSLRTNGKTEASTGDQITQLLSAYMPVGLHPRPRKVLVIGFGSGSTVYAVSQFPGVEKIDCVEIESAVLEAAPFLEELNHNVLKDPRVRMILEDARNYLSVTDERYDVIISEPSYLWSSGIATLFTREFYQQVLEHLEPQGIFLQWVQAYQLGARDIATVVRTLQTGFEQISLWRGSASDYLLFSSPKPRRFRLDTLVQAYESNPELRAYLADFVTVYEPEGVLGYYQLDDGALRELAVAGDLNTDDRTVLEYRAPFNINQPTDLLNHSLVRSLRREPLPSFIELADPGATALVGAETQVRAGMLGHLLGASLMPVALQQAPSSERTLLLRATLSLERGGLLEAIETLHEAERIAAQSPRVAYNLGQVYLSQGNLETARKYLERCIASNPDRLLLAALRSLVDLEVRAQNFSRAVELQRLVVEREPRRQYAEWARLGEILLLAGETQQAVPALEQSLVLEPLGYLARRHAADLLVQNGETEKALPEFLFLIRHYPMQDPTMYVEASRLHRSTGNLAEAREILRKAKRLFPASPEVARAHWELESPEVGP